MTDPELERLVEGLRGNPLDFAGPPLKARAEFEAMLATIPVADDIAFSDVHLGGVPTLRAKCPGASADAALIYFHGGAYAVGSAKGYRALAAELGRAVGATAYAVDYRLAPEAPLPAALDDAVASYRGLLEHGIPPSRIVVAGDSAGGGLAVALLASLRDAELPQPAAACVLSPWVDLTCSGATLRSKASEDPSLTEAGLRAMAGHYLGTADATDPRASPLFADLTGLPPMLIHVGSAEILLDDAVALARALGTAGSPVRLEIWPRMVHVWHAFAFMLGAGREAIAAAGDFLASHLKGPR